MSERVWEFPKSTQQLTPHLQHLLGAAARLLLPVQASLAHARSGVLVRRLSVSKAVAHLFAQQLSRLGPRQRIDEGKFARALVTTELFIASRK